MIKKVDIDKGFDYFNLNEKYKKRCYECAELINNNNEYFNSFNYVYNLLNDDDFDNVRKCWNIKSVNEMFVDNIDPFVTNLLIVLSYKTHIEILKKYKLDDSQNIIHKKRIKECFENDLIKRKYGSIRISQMLWAIYFIRVKIIEIGRLQYEFFEIKNQEAYIKIHIPGGEKLTLNKVVDSINNAKKELQSIFKIKLIKFVCNSWLLSNQLNKLISEKSNIHMFYNLFDVKDGENCIEDILNFVYSLKECDDYQCLSEDTSLQKLIKNELINGTIFKIGIGTLK